MYSYTYDSETGGILLNDEPTKLSKEPRPVYAPELDMLGIDRYYSYDRQQDTPYMWAEANRYFYRGVNIFNTKGGTLYSMPEIAIVNDDEGKPALENGSELIAVDIDEMNRRNHDMIEVIEQITVKKMYTVYNKYRKKVDRCHVALSGGKDSIVVLDLAMKSLPPDGFCVIFGDTKMEFPDTYHAIDKLEHMCCEKGIEFYRATSHLDPQESWRLFGPPSRVLRWCCTVHKSTPQTLKLREITGKDDFVGLDFVGVRKHESAMRSTYSEENFGKKQKGQYSHNPILEWTSAEVWAYIYANQLIVNNAYKKGNSRAGCLFCPMGGGKSDSFRYACYKSEIDTLTDIIKERINDDHIDTYISNSGWTERKNGRDLKENFSKYSEEIKDGFVYITIVNPNTEWQEWIKTLGDISFKYSITDTENGYVIKFPENANKTTEGKYFKQVFHKAAYCFECRACETNCRLGHLKFNNGLKIDNCVHCMECHNIDGGCLAYHSLIMPLHGGKQMKKNSINSFSDHAPMLEWVKDFFNSGNDYLENNLLGPMMIQKFKVFTRDSGLTEKNKTTALFDILMQYGIDSDITWGILYTNLVYNNIEFRWFVDNMPIDQAFSSKEFTDLLVGHDLSEKDANSVKKAFIRFCNIPLGTVLHFGEYNDLGRGKTTLIRTKCSVTDPRVLLYALYRYAEANDGYYTFSQTALLDFSKNSEGVSPAQIFGLTADDLEPMLRGLSVKYDDFINVTYTHDLDKITLRDYHKAEDVLILLEEE